MPTSRRNFALALVSALPFVSAICVALRLYARHARRTRHGWDDWLLILATLLSIGLIYPSVRNIHMWHIGYHIWEVQPTTAQIEPDLGEWYQILLAINLLNIPMLPLAKASIILILLRVGKIIPSVRRCLYLIFAFNFAACIVPWLVYIFICPPRTGNTWAPTTFNGLQCLGRDEQGHLLLFINCANLLTDLLVFPIPFFIMRELMNTDMRARLIIILTFASSLCVTCLSAAKIYVTYRDRISLISRPDWTYSIEFCISHGESNVGIIVACIPTLRGLFSRGSRRGTQTQTQSQTQTSSMTPLRSRRSRRGSEFASGGGGEGSPASFDGMRKESYPSPTFYEDELSKAGNVFITTRLSVDIESAGSDTKEQQEHQQQQQVPSYLPQYQNNQRQRWRDEIEQIWNGRRGGGRRESSTPLVSNQPPPPPPQQQQPNLAKELPPAPPVRLRDR